MYKPSLNVREYFKVKYLDSPDFKHSGFSNITTHVSCTIYPI